MGNRGVLCGVVAMCLVAVLGACDSPEPATSGGPPGIATSTPTDVGPPDVLDQKIADELAGRYLQCVNGAGFKLGDAWVHHFSGFDILVKTSVDVPAPVHAPCLESIGGTSTDSSSWGL